MKKIELNTCPVLFDKAGHTYSLDGVTLQGITSTLLAHALPEHAKQIEYLKENKGEILAAKASYGSQMHDAIERYICGAKMSEFSETEKNVIRRYKALTKGLKPIAAEYAVTDYLNFASMIDAILTDSSGNIILDDHKFTYQLNEEYVSWQLSIYAYLFELINPNLKVGKLVVSWLPRQVDARDELKELPRHSNDEVQELIFSYITGVPYIAKTAIEIKNQNTGMTLAPEVQQQFVNLVDTKKKIEAEYDELVKYIKELMVTTKNDKFVCDSFSISLSKAGTKKTFDKKKFSEEHPELYNSYISETPSERRLTIKIN